MRAANLARVMQPPLSIQLFGPLRILVRGEPLPRVRTRSVEWLLALLAMKDGPVSRSWLAGTLWPESSESQALLNLRTDLVRLRKALGEEAGRIVSGKNFELSLDGTNAKLDVREFDSLIRRDDEASLKRAVELYRGPLLSDCDREWVVADRDRRLRDCLAALHSLAESALAADDNDSALSFARRAATLDPHSDRTQRATMRAQDGLGDAPAALLSYRDYRLQLRGDLGFEPDSDTARLFQEIRQRAKVRASGDAPTKSTPDAAPVSESPSDTLPRPPHPLTPLIGREENLRSVEETLAGHRMLTLVGGGGVGKTRLAIATAHGSADRFPGGVAFVELATLVDGALLPHHLASTLGLPDESSDASVIMAQLARRIGNQTFLLVLDNCEHVLEASATLCHDLLSRCPNLRVVATSRQRLGLTGEVAWRVPSLPAPDLSEFDVPRPGVEEAAVRVTRFASVRLFVERARSAKPGFSLASESDAIAVAHICRQLDGIPLAIELASARVRSLSLDDIRIRLEDRFRLLTGGSRAVLPRHQTLQAAIEWSWNLLSNEECRLLGLVSVFIGGWTLRAAEEIARQDGSAEDESPEAIDLLDALVDKSLVVYKEGSVSAEPRYSLLETVREFAGRKLADSGGSLAAHSRHCDYFVGLAEEAMNVWKRAAGQSDWLDRAHAEHDNFRAALTFSQTQPNRAESGLRIAGALWWFWWMRGHLTEGRERCIAALSHEGASARTAFRAAALHAAGILVSHQGDYPAAAAFHEEAMAIRQEIGDRAGIAGSCHNLANVLLSMGRNDEAQALYESALALHRELGNRTGEQVALGGLGNVGISKGDRGFALQCFEQGLAMCRETGDYARQATYLADLGELAYEDGDYPRATELKQLALTVSREVGHSEWEAANLASLGKIARRQGRLDGALGLCREALAIQVRLGVKQDMLHTLAAIASIRFDQQSYSDAARLFGACRRLEESIGTPLPDEEGATEMIDTARERLGEAEFVRLWSEGSAASAINSLASLP